MKTRWLVVGIAIWGFSSVMVQGQVPSLINYQGRLLDGTNLVNASVTFAFRLFNQYSGGSPAYVETQTVNVVDGLYATHIGASPDYGTLATALTNSPLYLEVEANGSVMTPRERVAAVCYAITAGGVEDGAITTAMLDDLAVTGAKIANGAVTGLKIFDGAVHNVDLANNAVTGAKIADGSISNADLAANAVDTDELVDGSVTAQKLAEHYWSWTGDATTTAGVHFVGTTDDEPLEFHVNGERALRIEPDMMSPNILGGHMLNVISGGIHGAVIGGGGDSAEPNEVGADYSVVGGGSANRIVHHADRAVISGGYNNRIEGANGAYNADYTFIGGGEENTIIASATEPTRRAVISGGYRNGIGPGGDYTSIVGGYENTNNGAYNIIGGGQHNLITTNGHNAVIGGGSQNRVNASSATICGGYGNTASGLYAMVPGGISNEASQYSLAAGYRAKARHVSSFVWADSSAVADFETTANNQFLIRASGGVGINTNNPTSALTVAGGIEAATLAVTGTATAASFAGDGSALTALDGGHIQSGTISNAQLATGSVTADKLQDAYWTLSGNTGATNGTFMGTTDGEALDIRVNNIRALRIEPDVNGARIMGGLGAMASNDASTVSGGYYNRALNSYATIGGGYENSNSGLYATIGGGDRNTASGWGAAIPGGHFNQADGMVSLAAGNYAKALHDGTFVWGDNQSVAFASTATNQFLIRASGGVGINTNAPSATLTVAGDLFTTRITSPFSQFIAGSAANYISNDIVNPPLGNTIGGGSDNVILNGNQHSTIAGGATNQIAQLLQGSTISGGMLNDVGLNADYTTIGGGRNNEANGDYTTIGGGQDNTINSSASRSVIAGGHANEIQAANDVISGGYSHFIGTSAENATIAGGIDNSISTHSHGAVISGGATNYMNQDCPYAVIGGGASHILNRSNDFVVIAGGFDHTIWENCSFSVIGGGEKQTIRSGSEYTTIGGGYNHQVWRNCDYATIGGGYNNVVTNSAQYATIPGGSDNQVSGDYSLAAGRRAKALHDGAFVWADSQNSDEASTTNDQFRVRAQNGLVLTEDAGDTKTVSIGDRYRDNAVIAWARVSSFGSMGNNSYGVLSVTNSSTGVYDITLMDSAGDASQLIPIAIAEIDSAPSSASAVRIVSINQTAANTFSVYINNGTFSLINNDFVFMATGR